MTEEVMHQNILIEGLKHDFHIAFEKIDHLEEKMEAKFSAIDAKFASIDSRFDRIDLRFDRLEGITLDLGRRMNGVEAGLQGLQVRMEGLEVRMGGIDQKLGDLSQQMHAGFALLANRLDARSPAKKLTKAKRRKPQ